MLAITWVILYSMTKYEILSPLTSPLHFREIPAARQEVGLHSASCPPQKDRPHLFIIHLTALGAFYGYV